MTAPKNPRALGLPITIPAAEAIANLQTSELMDLQRAARRSGAKVSMNALKPADGMPFGRPAGDRQPTKAVRDAAAMHASYMVGDTTPSKVDLTIKDMAGPMLLEVTAIDCFDHNPRLFPNEKVEDIEASIRANGYHDALVVTRRRDGDRFMLAAGSNTTLRVLQELWLSTQDEKYRWVNCIFQPYESETRLLAQHLGENLNRGDMKFWEVAKGMVALLDQIERENLALAPSEKTFGLREQVEELTRRGLRANKSDIALWRFTTRFLAPLGATLRTLTNRGVRDHLQPRTNSLRGLAAKFNVSEAVYWQEIVTPTLAAFAAAHEREASDAPIDAAALCDQLEGALAERTGETLATIRQMLSMLKLSPELTLADLRTPSPNIIAGGMPPTSDFGDASADETPAGLPPTATQGQLPINPGLVRGPGVTPPSPRAPASPGPSSARAPAAQHQATGAAGPLFATIEPGGDPLQGLHKAVEDLLSIAGLGDTLRWHDQMPLGFFIEMPDRTTHARRKVPLGSPEYEARSVKTMVWWSLVLMTGQFREGCVPYIDHKSEFYRHYSVEAETSPLHGTDIEQNAPELDEILMHRLTPGPMRAAMQQMRIVEEMAARVFEQLPERWRRMLEVHKSAA